MDIQYTELHRVIVNSRKNCINLNLPLLTQDRPILVQVLK
jgi:hypothetical protein